MWRYGFNNPINDNDNEVFCGGYGILWGVANGSCGVCGDDIRLKEPRPHVTTGIYGNEIIAATYSTGEIIDIDVKITANHWGHFELKLCPMKESGEIVTQECLDEHPLEVIRTPAMRTQMTRVVAKLTCKALVQRSVEGMDRWCERVCMADLFQCPLDLCRCTADVTNEFVEPKPTLTTQETTITTTTTTSTTTTTTTTTSKSTTNTIVCTGTFAFKNNGGSAECERVCMAHLLQCPLDVCRCTADVTNEFVEPKPTLTTQETTTTTTTTTSTTSKSTTNKIVCTGTIAFKKNEGISEWCLSVCSLDINNCPKNMCNCVSESEVPLISENPATTASTTTKAPWLCTPTTSSTTGSTPVPWVWTPTTSSTTQSMIYQPETVQVEFQEILQDKFRYRLPTIDKIPQTFKYQVRLPAGIKCDRCVLQWTYKAGNTWAICPDGIGRVGCGPQEWFRNCGDIRIVPDKTLINATKPALRQTIYQQNNWGILEPLVVDSTVCVARDPENNTPRINDWCQKSCLQYPPRCDFSQCKCLSWCEAIGDLAGIDGTDNFCNMNCLKYPSDCPADKCRCYES